MTRNILTLKFNEHKVTFTSSGSVKKSYEVIHDGIVVISKESWRHPRFLAFDVIEDGETVRYNIESFLGNRFQLAYYRVRRNHETILQIG